MKAPLRRIAHARSGDKGNRSNLAIFAYEPADYGVLLREVTTARLKAEFGGLLLGEVARYELPNLHGLNFVMDQALEGGVNESLNLDGHGKSWSAMILAMEVELSGDE
ncbi:MAG: hypothetical protein HOK30_23745 [Rhodospirillaceae bacterium]|jgi:hypothetical protein|nr:hypothetical protein [Rhodospirillaceae bacterium]MBT5192897.1 hypothetical protein [Rhodospirillaceae bacterium]MBT5896801.1 hypothetical protein [Rhodospirillaceae bacterium]MBT6430701.1 hypothetical protein [Rhodospirillaceae bacterium]